MTDKEKVVALRICLMGVATCFRSRTESSTCIEDHHPNCVEYVTNVLDKVDGTGLYAGLEEETQCDEG